MKNKENLVTYSKIKTMCFIELGVLLLILMILLLISFNLVRWIPPCPIYSTFGILCPSCQGTRCVTNFVIGNFSTSFFYHPVFFITIIYFIIVNIIFIINSFRKKEILTFLYPTTKFWFIFLVILGIFTVLRNVL